MNVYEKRGSKIRSAVLLITLWLLFFVAFSVDARGFIDDEVKAAVETWVRQVTADSRDDAVVERMEPYRIDEEVVGYIAHLAGGGYCLTGANDRVLPVYYYSPNGSYDPANPGNLVILNEIAIRSRVLATLETEAEDREAGIATILNERALFWQQLIVGEGLANTTAVKTTLAVTVPTQMELDLTSQWDQNSPYNDQTPTYPPGSADHTYVGCGATATVQLMYYWQWPNSGVGSKTTSYDFWWRGNWDEEPLSTDPGVPANWGGGGLLEWSSANGGRLRMNGNWDQSILSSAANISNDPGYTNALTQLWSRLTSAPTAHTANFGATTYNWSILRDSHTDPPDAGDTEVAKLSYHLGIALGMNWGIWGSSTSADHIDNALADHFRYDADGVFEIMDSTSMEKMTDEIRWLRPFSLRGCPATGSCHIWVVFGYNKGTDPNRQFKMNMGWGGNNDGWYSLDNVTQGLNIHQYHVTMIAPLNVVQFVGSSSPGDGSPSAPYQNLREAVNNASDGTDLLFKAGTVNTITSGPLTIEKRLTLKGRNVSIQ